MKKKILAALVLLVSNPIYASNSLRLVVCEYGMHTNLSVSKEQIGKSIYTSSPKIRVLAKRGEFYIFQILSEECDRHTFAAKISDLGDLPENTMWPTREAEFVGVAVGQKLNGFDTEILVFKPHGDIMGDEFRPSYHWSPPGRPGIGKTLIRKLFGK